jgi:RNA polymerase sigma factor (sigma-70 family)
LLVGFWPGGLFIAEMKERSDRELLREYAEQGSESAFGELVARYTDLVYSAALRQVRSTDLARDVAQSVFTDLARKARPLAGKLKPDAAIVGWLYRATRYAALVLIRNEQRRYARERQAMEYLHPAPETAPDWNRIGPALDEAMARLNDTDRDALLLRFFQKQDFRAVGAALGVSDDAAQKRVARSLERIRALLARHGITTTAVALSTTLSLNAVQAAPAGLAATLASASLAGAAAGTGTTLTLLELMAMTKSQLGAVGAVIIASVAAPLIIQQQAHSELRQKNNLLQQENDRFAQLSAANERLSNLLAAAKTAPAVSNEQYSELLKLRGEVARLRRDVAELNAARTGPPTRTDMLTSIAERYSQRISQLKQFLTANPAESIPELQFMTDKDWLWLAGEKTPGTPEGYQRAMSLARLTVEGTVTRDILRPALLQYAKENNGRFPSDLSELRPFFKSPLDDAILRRWQILPASKLINLRDDLRDEDWVITQKAPVNRAIDQRIVFSIKKASMFANAPPNHWDVAP